MQNIKNTYWEAHNVEQKAKFTIHPYNGKKDSLLAQTIEATIVTNIKSFMSTTTLVIIIVMPNQKKELEITLKVMELF